MSHKRLMLAVGVLVVASLILSACQPTTVVTPETIITTVEVQAEPWTTPHPILGDVRVRQAMAYCTNKLELIQSVYPLIPADQQEGLVLNTMMRSGHWAYAGDENITIYDFDPVAGAALLEEAGWALADDGYRYNEAGEILSLKFTTTSAAFRQTWAAVWEQQMAACGMEIIRLHVPASWWFGDTTGLARRDFELGAYAWVGQVDPGGVTLYACDQIPSPANGWEGQNYPGWCNEAASAAIKNANNTLIQQERIDNYKILQQEYTTDVPTLPLFNRSETFAAAAALTGFEPLPGQEYYLYDVGKWEIPGQDTIVLGFTQEPASLFTLVEDAFVANLAVYMVLPGSITTKNYDFQAVYIKDFPTIENGGSLLNEVEVNAGDTVVDANGDVVVLEAGMMVRNFAGEVVEFTGTAVTMPQIVSTFEYIDGITWEDGEPLKGADFALSQKIACDPESGATSFYVCDRTASVEFFDVGYTHTWVTGYTDPLYFTPIWGTYPSHRVLSDGRVLADVPASEWATLPEIAEDPMGWGPYQLVEWVKGEKLVYAANPYWVFGTPATPNFVIQIITAEAAETLLLGGEVDMLASETLAGLTQTLADAEAAGTINTWSIAGGTWEHIDIALFIR
ncbi:MAG: ABC transporter substrate-binding protein [Chloroflexota bacterium]